MSGARFDAESVRHVARLARLSLTNEEIGRLCRDLSSIAEIVDRLGDAPLPAHQHDVEDAPVSLRADEPAETTVSATSLAGPDRVAGRFVVVPGVLPK
jgi:aspartyl/glutamyl-tRNA(Asn/Gln) amidotransferase C subunit